MTWANEVMAAPEAVTTSPLVGPAAEHADVSAVSSIDGC